MQQVREADTRKKLAAKGYYQQQKEEEKGLAHESFDIVCDILTTALECVYCLLTMGGVDSDYDSEGYDGGGGYDDGDGGCDVGGGE